MKDSQPQPIANIAQHGTITSQVSRHRPPIEGKLTERLLKQKKTPDVKGDVRVMKLSPKELRASAPSTDPMRIRKAGPAELLSLS